MSSNHQLFLTTNRNEAEVIEDIRGAAGLDELRTVAPFGGFDSYGCVVDRTSIEVEMGHDYATDGDKNFSDYSILVTVRNLDKDEDFERNHARRIVGGLRKKDAYGFILVHDLQRIIDRGQMGSS